MHLKKSHTPRTCIANILLVLTWSRVGYSYIEIKPLKLDRNKMPEQAHVNAEHTRCSEKTSRKCEVDFRGSVAESKLENEVLILRRLRRVLVT